MKNHSDNPFGLAASPGSDHLLHISCWRKNEFDGKTIYAFVHKFMGKAIAEAKSVSVFNEYDILRFIHLNCDGRLPKGATQKLSRSFQRNV
ncbi:hypothetical protein N7489_000550 [Penicillium chrysogenum]|uniref:Uncharacterized protein n=1 Tax=Penicillium chrysogenum TaxID=5076 RepID=A0ABQ8WGG6_PENCH|nr:uncharacterized protein N7489_000550 [Penicillium chrysogenum]KAJ5250140.1 hypothetical protein N7489_000550 [Penicillium chrysogenum]KAJ5269046.1 hypothetical protein N7505_004804 [Penicillium chrysogenum]